MASSKQEERVVATRVQSRGSDGGVDEGDGGDGNDVGMSRVWDVRRGRRSEDSRSRQICTPPTFRFHHEAAPGESSHAQLYPIYSDDEYSLPIIYDE